MSVRARKPAGRPDLAAASDSVPALEPATPSAPSEPLSTSAVPIDKKPVDDASGRVEPPPEKPFDVRRRTYVILSFWVIAVLLGLPIWWHTTSIYRASLPLDEMLDWSDGKLCRPVFPLQIAVQAPSLQQTQAQEVLLSIRAALDAQNTFSGHKLQLELSSSADTHAGDASERPENNAALTVRLAQSDSATSTTATLHPHLPILEIQYLRGALSSQPAIDALGSEVATHLGSTFAEEQAIISYLLSTSSVPSDQQAPAQSAHLEASIARRTTRSLKYAPTYHLTFSLFTDGPSPSSWDIEAAVQEYMQPILDLLKPIHNFTIDTQVQLYATPGVQNNLLSKEDLSSFINAAEWPLSPSIGGAPTVNFVVYVGNQTIGVPQASQPDGDSTIFDISQSWLIPQWGTVYLLPPPSQTHLDHTSLKQPLLTFTSHLLSLLGTPQSGNLPLRLSTLSRIRSADVLLRASSTLGSLARLSRALPSIAIPGSVADGVATAMQHLRLACGSLGGPEGLAHARIAEAEAERAFFEKSMVGQLYFPDEHKVAVYLPLLGPVGVPLVIGLINEIKAWRKRRREAKKAEEKSQ